jgi:hypothetical protein
VLPSRARYLLAMDDLEGCRLTFAEQPICLATMRPRYPGYNECADDRGSAVGVVWLFGDDGRFR